MHFSTGSKAPSWLPGAVYGSPEDSNRLPVIIEEVFKEAVAVQRRRISISLTFISILGNPISRLTGVHDLEQLRGKQIRPSLIAQDTQIARFDPDDPIFLSGSQIGILCNSFSKFNRHFGRPSFASVRHGSELYPQCILYQDAISRLRCQYSQTFSKIPFGLARRGFCSYLSQRGCRGMKKGPRSF